MAKRIRNQPSSLNIAFLNANGLKRKKNELEISIQWEQRDVVLISESHFVPEMTPRSLAMCCTGTTIHDKT